MKKSVPTVIGSGAQVPGFSGFGCLENAGSPWLLRRFESADRRAGGGLLPDRSSVRSEQRARLGIGCVVFVDSMVRWIGGFSFTDLGSGSESQRKARGSVGQFQRETAVRRHRLRRWRTSVREGGRRVAACDSGGVSGHVL